MDDVTHPLAPDEWGKLERLKSREKDATSFRARGTYRPSLEPRPNFTWQPGLLTQGTKKECSAIISRTVVANHESKEASRTAFARVTEYWHDSQLSYARNLFSATRLGWAIRSISFLTRRVVTGKLSNGSLKTKEHHQNHKFTDFLTGPGPEWANIAAKEILWFFLVLANSWSSFIGDFWESSLERIAWSYGEIAICRGELYKFILTFTGGKRTSK
jgi:hypothetical protein